MTQYVAAMQGLGPLHDELHALCGADREPGPVHRLLARLPPFLRERGAPYQLIVTTASMSASSVLLQTSGKSSMSSRMSRPARSGAGSSMRRPAPSRGPSMFRSYADLSLEQRTVLLRLRGIADPGPERAWESLVVTEDDHIDYPGSTSSRARFRSRCPPGFDEATFSSSATTSWTGTSGSS